MKQAAKLILLCSSLLCSSSACSDAEVFDRLNCLSEERVEDVRRDPSSALQVIYGKCRGELSKKLSPLELSETQLRAGFVAVLAHSMAPYGASQSLSLRDLLNDKALDCDNYATLAGHFSAIFLGDQIGLRLVGFDGGAIGNHTQIIAETDDGSLLLDPTIGLVATIGFDDLLSGKTIAHDDVRIFRQHKDKEIDAFAKRIAGALLAGQYRPSHLLYYFSSIDEYLVFSGEIASPWGPEIEYLIRRFPTPGARALRNNLIESGRKRDTTRK